MKSYWKAGGTYFKGLKAPNLKFVKRIEQVEFVEAKRW
jgi:hypothetical protein